jgi:hypothetical protein
MKDHLTKSSTEDFRTKFLTPEIVTVISGNLSDGNADVGEAAVMVVGNLMAHGTFNRQVVQRIGCLNLQQRTPGLNS